MDIFNIVLYKPLFNSLILIYNYIPGNDFGVAVIILTIIIKTILIPLSVKSVRSQKSLQDLQPKLKEIQDKYKDDKEKQANEILKIYKTQKINPFSGIFLAFLQIPILFALYMVFNNGLKSSELINLYSFVSNPVSINFLFLNIIDLSKPNILFALIAGVVQYLQTKMLLPKLKTQKNTPEGSGDIAKAIQFQTTYFLPIFTVIILFNLPSALGLYWTVSGLFSTAQQHFILKKINKFN
jgi:YidC/Oxa1 family membrane protein insertase